MTTNSTPQSPARDAGFSAERTEALVQVLEREIASARLPGAVALIARQGQLVLNQAVGQQNPADTPKPSPQCKTCCATPLA